MTYQQEFFISLLTTLAIEIPVIFLVLRFLFKRTDLRTSKIIFIGIIASSLTLPYLWFVLPSFFTNRIAYVFIGESLVTIVEAVIYWQLLPLQFNRALIASLIANLTSVLLGLLIFR